jgi:hypothetical protein
MDQIEEDKSKYSNNEPTLSFCLLATGPPAKKIASDQNQGQYEIEFVHDAYLLISLSGLIRKKAAGTLCLLL